MSEKSGKEKRASGKRGKGESVTITQERDEWVTYLSLNNSRHSPREQSRKRGRDGEEDEFLHI